MSDQLAECCSDGVLCCVGEYGLHGVAGISHDHRVFAAFLQVSKTRVVFLQGVAEKRRKFMHSWHKEIAVILNNIWYKLIGRLDLRSVLEKKFSSRFLFAY